MDNQLEEKNRNIIRAVKLIIECLQVNQIPPEEGYAAMMHCVINQFNDIEHVNKMKNFLNIPTTDSSNFT